MNRNRKIQALALAVSTSLLFAMPMHSKASAVVTPFAGAVASLYTVDEVYDTTDASTALSGANLTLSNILADTLIEEEVVENVSTEVALSENLEFENIGIATVSDYINVRAEASTDAPVVAKLYSKGAATVVEQEGEWYHITSGNAEGYVKAEYLEVGNEELAMSVSGLKATVNADVLNIRQDMSTESTVISSADQGMRLVVTDLSTVDDGWVKVNTSRGEGYVAADFVDVARLYDSVAETKEEEEARKEAELQAAIAAARNRQGSTPRSGANRTYNPPSGGDGAAVAQFALQFVGNPYVWAGTSLTNGADCSGFVLSVYKQFGVSLPHSSYAQANYGYGVSASEMQPGDVVCYGGHVGIAIGGGQIVHASNARDGIKVSNAFYRNIVAVRRFF